MKHKLADSKKGFTLVEMIVVIGITAVLGVIFTNTLVQTLRSQNKTKVIGQVKQNGQIALDRISTEIRQAEKIVCINDTDTNTDTIAIFQNGSYKRFRFHRPEPTDTPPANGYIEWDDFTVAEYGVDKDARDSCQEANLSPLPGRIKYLTDRDARGGISVDFLTGETRVFKPVDPSTQDGYGDLVTVQFKAQAGVGSGLLYEEVVREGGIPFSTTIQVRGMKR